MSTEIEREIIGHLMRIPNPSWRDVNLIKMRMAEKYGLSEVPSNAEIIRFLKHEEKCELLEVLRRKMVRTASGVTVVA
ncbi:MAG: tRNA uridine(34) 5-carboxymethylaminomethyl modification radical SAM/GNAT enzyme Elp3, partial [Candidatus Bathyarchaeia archaeon]